MVMGRSPGGKEARFSCGVQALDRGTILRRRITSLALRCRSKVALVLVPCLEGKPMEARQTMLFRER